MGRTRRIARATSTLTALALGASLATTAAPATAVPLPQSDTIVLVPYADATTAFIYEGATTTAEYAPVTDGIVEGNFSAEPGGDVLIFGVGSAPDGVIHVTPDEEGGAPTTSFTPKTINQYYVPIVGDYDGNGIDDIFWYGSGSAADSIWSFQPDGSHTVRHYTVSGLFQPIALDANDDGRDDIFWYGRGTRADSLWLFGADGTYAKRSTRVDGLYSPVVGTFLLDGPEGTGEDQIYWSSVDTADSIWTFDGSAVKTSRSVPDVNGAEPIVGHFLADLPDSIFWYRAGSAGETITNFYEEGPQIINAPSVNGLYVPFVGRLDGDEYDDIVWPSTGRLDIWELGNSGQVRTQTWISHPYTATVPAVARVEDEVF